MSRITKHALFGRLLKLEARHAPPPCRDPWHFPDVVCRAKGDPEPPARPERCPACGQRDYSGRARRFVVGGPAAVCDRL